MRIDEKFEKVQRLIILRFFYSAANLPNDQKDKTRIQPIEQDQKIKENKLIIHYRHEKRFQSFKIDMHHIYKNSGREVLSGNDQFWRIVISWKQYS